MGAVQRKKSRAAADVVGLAIPACRLFVLPLALRGCVFGYLEFHGITFLVRVARTFRGIVANYATSVTEITLHCQDQDASLQRLALSLLERHARSLRSIAMYDEDHSSIVPEHSECAMRVITRNATTLRYVEVDTLEEYLAACACPMLDVYHPFNHGMTRIPLIGTHFIPPPSHVDISRVSFSISTTSSLPSLASYFPQVPLHAAPPFFPFSRLSLHIFGDGCGAFEKRVCVCVCVCVWIETEGGERYA